MILVSLMWNSKFNADIGFVRNTPQNVGKEEMFQNLYGGIRKEYKDKPFEYELSWLCEENKYIHSYVPANLKVNLS